MYLICLFVLTWHYFCLKFYDVYKWSCFPSVIASGSLHHFTSVPESLHSLMLSPVLVAAVSIPRRLDSVSRSRHKHEVYIMHLRSKFQHSRPMSV